MSAESISPSSVMERAAKLQLLQRQRNDSGACCEGQGRTAGPGALQFARGLWNVRRNC